MLRHERRALLVLAITCGCATRALCQSSNPADLPLRPGDRLLVKVWVDTVFADSARIDEHGTVVLPRLGALTLTRLSAGDIADSVRLAYTRLIRTTAIEVTPLRRVTVLGEVKQPATYYMETASTLRDAVAMAGGITDIGAIGHAVILRDSGRINVRHWERSQDADLIMHSGDVVWIDREPWLKRNIFSVISGLGIVFSLIYTIRR
jgi:polysaccharide biosynthesis/export protein